MSRDQRRQVLPDVNEGAEAFGYSIFGLMKIYSPALAALFFSQHYLIGMWSWVGILSGIILTIGATVAVLAAPSHESPSEYVRSVWKQYTQQGVELHE